MLTSREKAFIESGGKFIHLRYFDENNELIQNAGITVAYLLNPADHNLLLVSFARCHPSDNYNKKIGRAISIGRMLHTDYYIVHRQGDNKDFDLVTSFVNQKVMSHYDSED
jgi:hypothetical protein